MRLRIILFLFISLFRYQSTIAQLTISIESGLNMSKIKNGELGFNNSDINNKFSYFIGVAPKYQLSEKIFIISEISFSDKGFQVSNQKIGIEDSKFRHQYLIITPKLEYKVLEHVTLGLGIYSGIKLGEAQKIPGYNWESTSNIKTIKPIDYGVVASIKTNYKNFYLKLSYEFGLENISNINFTNPNFKTFELEWYSRNFQIGIGYLIKKTKNL